MSENEEFLRLLQYIPIGRINGILKSMRDFLTVNFEQEDKESSFFRPSSYLSEQTDWSTNLKRKGLLLRQQKVFKTFIDRLGILDLRGCLNYHTEKNFPAKNSLLSISTKNLRFIFMYLSGKKLKTNDPLYKWAFDLTPGEDRVLLDNLQRVSTYKRYLVSSALDRQQLYLNMIDNDIHAYLKRSSVFGSGIVSDDGVGIKKSESSFGSVFEFIEDNVVNMYLAKLTDFTNNKVLNDSIKQYLNPFLGPMQSFRQSILRNIQGRNLEGFPHGLFIFPIQPSYETSKNCQLADYLDGYKELRSQASIVSKCSLFRIGILATTLQDALTFGPSSPKVDHAVFLIQRGDPKISRYTKTLRYGEKSTIKEIYMVGRVGKNFFVLKKANENSNIPHWTPFVPGNREFSFYDRKIKQVQTNAADVEMKDIYRKILEHLEISKLDEIESSNNYRAIVGTEQLLPEFLKKCMIEKINFEKNANGGMQPENMRKVGNIDQNVVEVTMSGKAYIFEMTDEKPVTRDLETWINEKKKEINKQHSGLTDSPMVIVVLNTNSSTDESSKKVVMLDEDKEKLLDYGKKNFKKTFTSSVIEVVTSERDEVGKLEFMIREDPSVNDNKVVNAKLDSFYVEFFERVSSDDKDEDLLNQGDVDASYVPYIYNRIKISKEKSDIPQRGGVRRRTRRKKRRTRHPSTRSARRKK